MKLKLLSFCILSMLPFAANASIPYRTEQVDMPVQASVTGEDDMALARLRRFYVGGMYDFTMWNDGDNITGKNTSGFEALVGVRAFDIFRVEANYIYNTAKWDAFELTGHVAMLNAIVDARIGNLYRPFYHQRLVPYVGIGAGVSWNSFDGGAAEKDVTPVLAAMAGLSIEMGQYFAVDLGYRYMYMFSPKFETAPDLTPMGHQFRVGARVHF